MKELCTRFGACVADAIIVMRRERRMSLESVANLPCVIECLGEYSEKCLREVESREFDAPVGVLPVLDRAFDVPEGTIYNTALEMCKNESSAQMLEDGAKVLTVLEELADSFGPPKPDAPLRRAAKRRKESVNGSPK